MISIQSFSEPGDLRNEDAFLVQSHPQDPDCWLCVLADGQGGQFGGAAAAELACRSAMAAAIAHPSERLIDPASWPSILQRADCDVEAEPTAGYTTLAALGVCRNCVAGASSGDSAVLMVSDGRTVQLTAGQQKNPPIGSGAAIAVPFAAKLDSPWRLLLLSDGVWKYVDWDRVIDVALRAESAAVLGQLQQFARLPVSGRFQDDFTVVMLEGDKSAGE